MSDRRLGSLLLLVAFLGSARVRPAGALVDGDLDPTLFPPFGSSVTYLNLGTPNYYSDHVRATAIQPDGKILVEADSLLPSGEHVIGVTRLLPDGSFDLAFGNAGITYIQHGGYTAPGGLQLQPDGRILVGGTTLADGDSTFFVGRLTAEGLLDTSFNSPWGYTIFDFFFFLNPGYYAEGLAAMALQEDGKIVLVGDLAPGASRDLGVARLNGDGSVDLAFGGQVCGCTTVGFDLGGDANDYARAVAVDASGRIVVAGQAHWGGTDWDWALFRLTPGGTLDPTFNGSGKETLVWDLSLDRTDLPSRIVTLADGRFVVAGTATVDDQGQTFRLPALARFAASGGLDPTFGSGAHPGRCLPAGILSGIGSEQVGLAADDRGRLLLGLDPLGGYGALRLDADCQNADPFAGPGGALFDTIANGFGDVVVGPDQRIVVTGTVAGAFPGWFHVGLLRLWVTDLFRDAFESGSASRWSSATP